MGPIEVAGPLLPKAIVADLSHWQGDLTQADFETAVRTGNLVGVVVKLIQGGKADPAAAQLLYAAYEAGVRQLGTYDFGTAEDDAQAFYNAIVAEFTAKCGGVLVALDAEKNVGNQMIVSSAEFFVSTISEELNRHPTLYMGRAGPDGTGKGLPSAGLSACDLWLPAYGNHAENLSAILPAGFRLPNSDTDRGGVLRMWQFTDGTTNGEPMPGLGPVDQSQVLFSERVAFAAWWGR